MARIGIDLHSLGDLMQGSRTYIYNVAKSVIELDSTNDYVFYFTNPTAAADPVFHAPNVQRKLLYPKKRIVRLPLMQPLALALHRVQVFHCQYIAPPLCPCPYVISLHDIIHEIYPQYYPKTLRVLMSATYPASARRASKILTTSAFSKDCIVRLYRVPEDNVKVVPAAVSPEFHPMDDPAAIQRAAEKYGIRGPYMLYVGRLEPRKNIPGLVHAYHKLRSRADLPHKLVIAGMKDFLYHDIFQLVREKNLEDHVVFTGGIAQEDLPAVFNGADLFVYPSFAEGFGIPALEAMACGTPVVTSNSTSLPEVVGDAGLMIDPNSTDEIADAMLKVLEDAELRETMRRKGIDRAAQFSWNETARHVLDIYREVAQA